MGTEDTTRILATSIQSELGALPASLSWRFIYKVSEPLRAVKHEAYTPSMVSIGPYHCKDPKLLPMENQKLKYLKTFLHDSQGNEDLYNCLQVIKKHETLIRECYADPIPDLTGNEFIKMVLVDGVFIIELLRRINGLFAPTEDDFIIKRPSLLPRIFSDLYLAENQLPFFVVQDLYDIAFNPVRDDNVPRFIDIACKFYNVDMTRSNLFDTQDGAGPLHLLDLMRYAFIPSQSRNEFIINIENGMIFCPSVTRLREAGIKFEVASGHSKKLTDINFDEERAVLTIPEMIIDHEIEIRLRNLIALEECHCLREPYISEYVFLMDCLINTSKDVEVLVKGGIFKNGFGSDDDVSDLFNNLGTRVNIVSRQYYYARLTSQLNAHYNKRWNIHKATLKHSYFSHPWAAMSVIYAVVLLILTVVQVITGILSLP